MVKNTEFQIDLKEKLAIYKERADFFIEKGNEERGLVNKALLTLNSGAIFAVLAFLGNTEINSPSGFLFPFSLGLTAIVFAYLLTFKDKLDLYKKWATLAEHLSDYIKEDSKQANLEQTLVLLRNSKSLELAIVVLQVLSALMLLFGVWRISFIV